MKHIEILKQNEDWERNSNYTAVRQSKDLRTRAMGRFYTHEIIGRYLAQATLASYTSTDDSDINVLDPFCGDGRLIYWLLQEIAIHKRLRQYQLRICLWEYDEEALSMAKENITEIAKNLKLKVDIHTAKGDTFLLAPQYLGQFHIVITNPPWELMKPDSRDLLQFNNQDVADYKAKVKEYNRQLTELYPLSKPKGGFLSSNINLARYGTEVALRLTRNGGVCGFVSPVSLLSDHVSIELRRWIFENHALNDFAFFPAEAKLFNQVDQSAITLVASPGLAQRASSRVTIYNSHGQQCTQSKLNIDMQELEGRDFIFPIHFGLDAVRLLSKWKYLSTVRDLEDDGLWLGRELDETRYRDFIGDIGEYLFVKGYMVKRFGMEEIPQKFVNPDGPSVPKSAEHYRIAWRDVSRPTQKRRIHATIIPFGWVTGNSLSVAYFHNDDIKRLKALLAIMNSLVFEFQVRSLLSTNHISLSAIRRVRIPDFTSPKIMTELAELSDRNLLTQNSFNPDLEVRVAHLYDLTMKEFKMLLSSFNKIEKYEVDELLSNQLWQNKSQASSELRNKYAD